MRIHKKIDVKVEILGIIYKFSKSIVFNVFMLILGFVIGFSSVMIRVHNNVTKGNDYQRIENIDKSVAELRDIANFIEQENGIFKCQIAHENECMTNILHKIIK